jgi:hypothetical protein
VSLQKTFSRTGAENGVTPTARLVVALAAALVVAGCVGPAGPGTPTTQPASPTGSSDATSPHSHYRSYEVTARPVEPTDVARALTLSREEVADEVVWRGDPFVAALFAEGRAERVHVAPEPEDDPGPFANGTLIVDDAVFALEKRVVARRTGAAYSVDLEGPLHPDHHEDYARAEREAVARSSLSPADRALVGYADSSRDFRPGEGVRSAGYDYIFATASARANATLADGERHYVRDGDALYRVRAKREGTGVRYRVVYDRRQVADSLAALYDAREDELVGSLTDADPAVHRLVADVAENGTAEWSGERRAPERFRATWAWVRERPPEGPTAFVRHDGQVYAVEVWKAVE